MMRVEASITIDKPVSVVWDFYAVNHAANHPRWDETVELNAQSNEPTGVGTVFNRRVTRFGNVTEGTMEVIEFEPETSMRVKTHDGPMTIDGFALFRAIGDEKTEMTIGGEIPGIDDSTAERIKVMMGRSVSNIKALIETEI